MGHVFQSACPYLFVSVCVCLSVCHSVCPRISKTSCPYLVKLLLHVACGLRSVLFWRLRDTLCTSGFVDYVMFA